MIEIGPNLKEVLIGVLFCLAIIFGVGRVLITLIKEG